MAKSTTVANRTNRAKGKYTKWLSKPIPSSIIGSIFVLIVVYVVGYFGIRENISHIKEQVDFIKPQNDSLRLCTDRNFRHFQNITNDYAVKEDGIEIKVGISKDLKQNTISAFKGNKVNLYYDDPVRLTNVIKSYRPSINLQVGYEFERNTDESQAEIFISKEAAEQLGFKDYKKIGVITLFLKKISKDKTG